MSGTISGGVIKFERRIKTGEFEHKHAAAEISFTAEEGGDPTIITNHAGDIAAHQVHCLLAKPFDPTAVLTDKDHLAAAATSAAKGKDKKAAAKPPAPSTGTAQADPAAIGGDEPAKTQTAASAQPVATQQGNAADPAALDDLLGSAPREINDVELTTAISKKNGETKNALAIRQLIGTYTPQDGQKHQAAEIAQDKRAAFLAELDKVPAVA